MNQEQVAAVAFVDELQKIAGELSGDLQEKLASSFHGHLIGDVDIDVLAGFFKEAGIFDKVRSFIGGGNENGIPMSGLGSQLSESNPFQGMGSSLMQGGRALASGAAGKLRSAAGAAKGLVSGGNENGIPMNGLAAQAADSNPFHGMGANLAQGARDLGGAAASRMRAAWHGGPNAQGVPMMGMKDQIAASNPLHGMGSSMAEGAAALGRPSPSFAPPAGGPAASPAAAASRVRTMGGVAPPPAMAQQAPAAAARARTLGGVAPPPMMVPQGARRGGTLAGMGAMSHMVH